MVDTGEKVKVVRSWSPNGLQGDLPAPLRTEGSDSDNVPFAYRKVPKPVRRAPRVVNDDVTAVAEGRVLS